MVFALIKERGVSSVVSIYKQNTDMMVTYIYGERRRSPLESLKQILLTLVLAVVLSALEVDRRERFSEPTPIVLTLSGYAPPLLRARPFRSHYRESLARRNAAGLL